MKKHLPLFLAMSLLVGLPVLLACVLFGVADAFTSNTATQSMGIPPEPVGCIPYVVTTVALVIYSYRRKKQRRRLGVAAN